MVKPGEGDLRKSLFTSRAPSRPSENFALRSTSGLWSPLGLGDVAMTAINGIQFDWEPERGLFRVAGSPSLAIWIESSLAGMMQGMQQMVGTERFNLSMQAGGRDSVAGDWQVIAQAESFEVGFRNLASIAVTCGWGAWTVESVDRQARRAVFRTVNSWEPLYQLALGVCWGSGMMAGKVAGHSSRLFGVDCWATQTHFQARGDSYDQFEVAPSDQSLEQKLEQLLSSDQATRADLAVALKRLEDENAERKRAEREARERLATIETLSTPILQVWDGVVALPVLGEISGSRANMIMERLLAEIQRTHSRFAILDLTGVDVVDTRSANHLLRVVRGLALLGSTCVISGIRPAVAQTMVAIQADFGSVVTMATLRDALGYCIAQMRR